MISPMTSILERSLEIQGRKLNILTAPTHERYETGLCLTGHNFYAVRADGIKDWNCKYGKIPKNYHLLDRRKDIRQAILHKPIDLVLSQNKFGQYQMLSDIARQLHVPLISLEHTLPIPEWSPDIRAQLKNMRGTENVFISSFSINEWDFDENDPAVKVIKHMVDTDVFNPGKQSARDNRILSVVNDWINRDWCKLPGQKILTLDGYKNIEEISTNDTVLTDGGLWNKVSQTFVREYNGDMVEIEIDNNEKISFTPDHNIRMFRANINSQWKYKAAKNIKPGDLLRFPRHIQTDFSITDADYAWLVGLIIGDGHITKNGCIQISFNKNDIDLANKAKDILSSLTHTNLKLSTRAINKGVITLDCSSKIFGNWLREKIYKNKYKLIPDIILNSSDFIRISCLQGLFAADGSFKNGKSKCKRFVYTSNSATLASQVSSILHSIGVKCSINTVHRDTNKKKNTTIYRVVGYGKENVELCYDIIHGNVNYINVSEPYYYTVTNVKIFSYTGKVYNCEVENDHSYVCYPGFVAHNCCNFSGWRRISNGLPVQVVGDTPGLSRPASSTEELVSFYRNNKVFLNTSTISPVPTALLEAMACGCAVVSTATCMIPEVIEHGVDGFISNNEKELREYCELLLNDTNLATKMGYNATKKINRYFGKEAFINNWNTLFYNLANKPYLGEF